MNILRKANEIVKIIKADYDADWYIAISSDIGDLSEVADKMEELEVLMENKFYHPEIHVFYPNMEGETPGIIQFDDDTFMKQMKQDIKMKKHSGSISRDSVRSTDIRQSTPKSISSSCSRI